MTTQDQTQVAEQEKKDTTRFWELDKKTDRNEDENKEHGELKTKYANTAKNRIGTLTGEKKTALERADTAEERASKAEQELETLKSKQTSEQTTTVVGDVSETKEVKGQKWYTDGALVAQIKAGTISEQAAIDYQAKRNRIELVVEVREDIKKESAAETLKTTRETDAQAVLDAHPEFSLKHPEHNPNDPLYKEWKELVSDGYGANPQGLMKALKKAKRNLGIKDTHVDRSADLGLEDTASPADKGDKTQQKEVALTDVEESSAVDMYTSVTNPATNRLYTRDEAIAKAKVAKKARMRK